MKTCMSLLWKLAGDYLIMKTCTRLLRKFVGGYWVGGVRWEDCMRDRRHCPRCWWDNEDNDDDDDDDDNYDNEYFILYCPRCWWDNEDEYDYWIFCYTFSPGLDQNLVTAASYMVPTKYTKYAKQVNTRTPNYDDDGSHLMVSFYNPEQKKTKQIY